MKSSRVVIACWTSVFLVALLSGTSLLSGSCGSGLYVSDSGVILIAADTGPLPQPDSGPDAGPDAGCGLANQPCCANSQCNSANLFCSDNECRACGTLNQSCCAGSTCQSNLTCSSSQICVSTANSCKAGPTSNACKDANYPLDCSGDGSACCGKDYPYACASNQYCYATAAGAEAECGSSCQTCTAATSTNSCLPAAPKKTNACTNPNYPVQCSSNACGPSGCTFACVSLGGCFESQAAALDACGSACQACTLQ